MATPRKPAVPTTRAIDADGAQFDDRFTRCLTSLEALTVLQGQLGLV